MFYCLLRLVIAGNCVSCWTFFSSMIADKLDVSICVSIYFDDEVCRERGRYLILFIENKKGS